MAKSCDICHDTTPLSHWNLFLSTHLNSKPVSPIYVRLGLNHLPPPPPPPTTPTLLVLLQLHLSLAVHNSTPTCFVSRQLVTSLQEVGADVFETLVSSIQGGRIFPPYLTNYFKTIIIMPMTE